VNKISQSPTKLRFETVFQATTYATLLSRLDEDNGLDGTEVHSLGAASKSGPFFITLTKPIPLKSHASIYIRAVKVRSKYDAKEFLELEKGNRLTITDDQANKFCEAISQERFICLLGFGVEIAKEVGYTPYQNSSQVPCDLCSALIWLGPEQSKRRENDEHQCLCQTCCYNMFGEESMNSLMPLTNKTMGE